MRVVPLAALILLTVLSFSCITDPDPQEFYYIEILSVDFTGDSTWQASEEGSQLTARRASNRSPVRSDSLLCRYTIEWTPYFGPEIDHLSLYRSTSPGIPDSPDDRLLLVTMQSDSIRVCHDTNQLEWEKTYYYCIVVEDLFGSLWWSNEVAVTSPSADLIGSSMTPLPVPDLELAQSGWISLVLTWNACPQEWFAGYSLFRSQTPFIEEHPEVAELVLRSADISDTTYTDPDLIPGEEYYYALRLDAALGLQSWSNEVSGIGPSHYPDHMDKIYGYIDYQDIHDDHLEVGSAGPYVYCVQKFYYESTSTSLRQLTLSLDCVGGGLLDRPGMGGPFDLDPATDRIFVAENYETPSRVLVFDAVEMELLDQIVVGDDAIWIQTVPSSACVYFALPGRIDVYSTTDCSFITSIPSGLLCPGSRMCVSPDGSRVYCTVPGEILVIDTAVHEILYGITGETYVDLVCSGDGSRLYGITNGWDLAAIDSQSGEPDWITGLNAPANGLCLVPPDDTYLMVSDGEWGNPLVLVVETGTGNLVDQIDSGDEYIDGPGFAIACSPDGAYAYVVSWYTWGYSGIARLSR
jgi:DNA-binding beta-propeller fold protein YncE